MKAGDMDFIGQAPHGAICACLLPHAFEMNASKLKSFVEARKSEDASTR